MGLMILDIFAGKGGELRRKEIEARGHKLVTLDINHSFGCDIKANVMQFDEDTLGEFDLIWASPPCETWSVASIGHHWNKDHTPKTLFAKEAIDLVKRTIEIMGAHARIGWVMENPRGMLRTMDFMKPYRRFTTTYCQYGEKHMKPTDLWICGLNWKPRPACKNGDPCHERAPRGARTGTQGIKGYADRSIVPTALWLDMLESVENDKQTLKDIS
jgi:site-specific DNA-cytosine methylase